MSSTDNVTTTSSVSKFQSFSYDGGSKKRAVQETSFDTPSSPNIDSPPLWAQKFMRDIEDVKKNTYEINWN